VPYKGFTLSIVIADLVVKATQDVEDAVTGLTNVKRNVVGIGTAAQQTAAEASAAWSRLGNVDQAEAAFTALSARANQLQRSILGLAETRPTVQFDIDRAQWESQFNKIQADITNLQANKNTIPMYLNQAEIARINDFLNDTKKKIQDLASKHPIPIDMDTAKAMTDAAKLEAQLKATQDTAKKQTVVNIDTKQAESNIAKLHGSMQRMFEMTASFIAANLFQNLGNQIGNVVSGVVGASAGFTEMMTTIQNNTGATTDQINQMSAGIQEMAARSNVPLTELGDAMLHVTDFGFYGADAIKILDAAMMSASSTGGNTAKTTETVASALHQFGIEADGAIRVTDIFHTAAQLSNITFEQFAEHAQRAIAVGAAFNIRIDEMAAIMATLTRNGFDAAESQTGLVNMFTHIAHPAAEARKELERVSKLTGVDLVKDFSAVGLSSRGVTGILGDLEAAYKRMGLTESQASDETMRLLNAQRGGIPTMILQGKGAKDLAQNLRAMDGVLQGEATPTMDAYAKSQQTLAYQWGELQNKAGLIAKAIGDKLTPTLTHLATTANAAANAILQGNWNVAFELIRQGWQGLMTDLGNSLPALQGFADFLRDHLDIVLIGLATTITAVVVPAFVLLLAPIAPVALAIAALGAAVGALYLAWQENFMGIQDIAASAWAVIEPVFSAFVEGVFQLRDAFNQDGLAGVIDVLPGIIDNIATQLAGLLDTVMGLASQLGAALGEWVWVALGNLMESLGVLLGWLTGWIFDTAIPAVWNATVGFVEALLHWTDDSANQAPVRLDTVAVAIWNWIADAGTQLWNAAQYIGLRLIGGIAEGLQKSAPNLLKGLNDFANAVVDQINHVFGSSIGHVNFQAAIQFNQAQAAMADFKTHQQAAAKAVQQANKDMIASSQEYQAAYGAQAAAQHATADQIASGERALAAQRAKAEADAQAAIDKYLADQKKTRYGGSKLEQ
jgi:TP901 family phage tail tape measure protein